MRNALRNVFDKFSVGFSDELPTALLQAEVPFSELCVYETVAQPPEGGKKGSGESNNGGFTEISRPSSPDWVVFFSPSGVDSFLQTYPYTEQESCIWRSIKLAAIGETTAADMVSRAAWLAPHVVAAAPNAASLLDSISSYCDTSIGRTDPT
jgi:uroporphyrinogen-III synthase